MSRWTTPSQLTVKIPKLETIVFVLLLVLAVGIVAWVWVYELVNRPGPPIPPASENSKDDPKVTDWISAIFTALGSVATAGALWLGAVTFRRQVQDQHRAQASAVIVRVITQNVFGANRSMAEVRNGSSLPIYDVDFEVLDQEFEVIHEVSEDVVVANGLLRKFFPRELARYAHVDFRDSAGTTWRRYANGSLIEVSRDGTMHIE